MKDAGPSPTLGAIAMSSQTRLVDGGLFHHG